MRRLWSKIRMWLSRRFLSPKRLETREPVDFGTEVLEAIPESEPVEIDGDTVTGDGIGEPLPPIEDIADELLELWKDPEGRAELIAAVGRIRRAWDDVPCGAVMALEGDDAGVVSCSLGWDHPGPHRAPRPGVVGADFRWGHAEKEPGT